MRAGFFKQNASSKAGVLKPIISLFIITITWWIEGWRGRTGGGGEGRGEDPVKIMIENNRNRINVQSCSVEGYRGLVGNDHRFQGSVIIRLEDKHYVNDLHYPQIIEL